MKSIAAGPHQRVGIPADKALLGALYAFALLAARTPKSVSFYISRLLFLIENIEVNIRSRISKVPCHFTVKSEAEQLSNVPAQDTSLTLISQNPILG